MQSFQRHWSPLFFISRSSSFSVIHVNNAVERKSRLCWCCFLSLKFRVALSALTPKGAGAWNAKFHPSLHEGVDKRTDVQTIFSEPKFLGCIDNQIFLPMVLRYKLNFKDNYWFFWKFSFFKYLHLKCFKFSLKITHFTSLYLNSTCFTVQ